MRCPYCQGTGNVPASIGARFRALRDEHGLTQTEMAERCGITRSQMSNIEADRSRPGLEVLLNSAEHFNVSLDWLCGRDEQTDAREAAE